MNLMTCIICHYEFNANYTYNKYVCSEECLDKGALPLDQKPDEQYDNDGQENDCHD